MTNMTISLPRSEEILPHRPPTLFVDEVTAAVTGQSASGVWNLFGDEWVCGGHFPGRPTSSREPMGEVIPDARAVAPAAKLAIIEGIVFSR